MLKITKSRGRLVTWQLSGRRRGYSQEVITKVAAVLTVLCQNTWRDSWVEGKKTQHTWQDDCSLERIEKQIARFWRRIVNKMCLEFLFQELLYRDIFISCLGWHWSTVPHTSIRSQLHEGADFFLQQVLEHAAKCTNALFNDHCLPVFLCKVYSPPQRIYNVFLKGRWESPDQTMQKNWSPLPTWASREFVNQCHTLLIQ